MSKQLKLKQLASLLIFLFCCTSIFAQEQSVTVKVKNASLTDVFNVIEKQTTYRFSYRDVVIDSKKDITISKTNTPVSVLLNEVLDFKKLNYSIVSPKSIVISDKINTKVKTTGETKNITGTILDTDGVPMIGVNIAIENTAIGTVSDLDGKFSITVPENSELTISYIGYISLKIKVDKSKSYDIVLKEDATLLDEVVVVGYGTSQKKDLTGAVGIVSGDLIESRQTIQVSQALQGAVAGVSVTRNSGAPGTSGTIRVRGNTTIGNNEALIILDGVPIDDINNVNPNDIESMSVLKDAAASSIYGSRAAAGVILITTKRAKAGQSTFNYNYEYGIEKPTQMPEYVDVVRYMTLVNERQLNDSGAALYAPDYINNYWANNSINPDLYPAADWQDLIYKSSAHRQRHEFNMTMGTDKVKTKASFSYVDIEGLYNNSSYNRYMLRINNDVSLHKMLTANLDVSYKRSNSINPADSYIASQTVGYMSRVLPGIYDDRYVDGRYAPGKDGLNILAEVNDGGTKDYIYNQLNGRFVLDFKPIEGLSVKAVLAPTFDFNKYKTFSKSIEYTDKDDPSRVIYTSRPQTSLDEARNDAITFNGQFLASYKKTFGTGNNFDFLLGYEENSYKYEGLKAGRTGFLIDNFPYLDLGDENLITNSGNAYETALRSYFGRVNYNYMQKYYLQGNFRYDGSSRFHKNHRWALFPSISAGWIITEESFMKNTLEHLPYLKLRGSWGQVGNERVGNYPYQAAIAHNDALFWQNGTIISSKTGAQVKYALDNITWETTESYDIGLDMSLLDQRLSISTDYFQKETKDILLLLEIPLFLGLEPTNQNSGIMKTKGWELETSWRDNIGDFRYSISFNLSDALTKMTEMKGTSQKGSQAILEGFEFNEWYGYKAKGIYQNQTQVDNLPKLNPNVQVGDICYEDISGPNGVPDGIISPEYDRVPLGGSLPRYTYGGSINLGYKNFDLAISYQGVGKVKSRLSNVQVRPFQEGGIGNVPKIIDGNFWSSNNTPEENLRARYPRLSSVSGENNYQMSDFWLIDGSYFRIKNITIGYKVPLSANIQQYIKSLRLYVAANDVLSIDKYPKGWDPESTATGYPIVTTFMTGLNLTF